LILAVHQVCLLLGSNIQPEKNLLLAVQFLGRQLEILRVSSVWETPPIGSPGPNFLNAAVLAHTELDAKTLKDQVLTPLEAHLGRVRTPDKYAPRTIDLDLILFDERLADPALWQYAHRAVPVAEVLPEVTSESGESLQATALRLSHSSPIQLRPDVSIQIAYPGSSG